MKVRAITETRVEECRVALTPQGVHALNESGHQAYVLGLAERGLDALREDDTLAVGASTIRGKLVNEPVASAQGLPYVPLERAF